MNIPIMVILAVSNLISSSGILKNQPGQTQSFLMLTKAGLNSDMVHIIWWPSVTFQNIDSCFRVLFQTHSESDLIRDEMTSKIQQLNKITMKLKIKNQASKELRAALSKMMSPKTPQQEKSRASKSRSAYFQRNHSRNFQ